MRPGARYFHSVRLLQRIKEIDPSIFTKSGIMVGLGEERNEVPEVLESIARNGPDVPVFVLDSRRDAGALLALLERRDTD